MVLFSLSAILVLAATGYLLGIGSAVVDYPEGYRNWAHVKTLTIENGHPLYEAFGGIHHIYANKKAMEGYRANRKFKDGSVIVFDLLETVRADNAVSEGNRKVVVVMQKDSKRFKNTGGWGFEGFRADTKERVVKDMYADCFSCHESEKESDYVFSQYRK